MRKRKHSRIVNRESSSQVEMELFFSGSNQDKFVCPATAKGQIIGMYVGFERYYVRLNELMNDFLSCIRKICIFLFNLVIG